MATHRYDPYLWVHLAGLATVPLWLAICTLGLAVGSPQWPGLELALLALLGVSPALAMQLGRPFYIFSLLALTLKSTALSDDQRRMLTLFQQWWVRGLAVAAPVPLLWLLWEIYPRAVVASDITPFAPLGHVGGLAVAAGSFAMANLFLQVPVSVLAVLATSDKRFKRTTPYPLDKVKANFTQVGIPLNRLLPEVLPPDGAVPTVEEMIDQELVSQSVDAVDADTVDLETAVGAEMVEAGLADSELTDLETESPFDLGATDLETESPFDLGATVPATKMDEAQVWAEALQSSTESSVEATESIPTESTVDDEALAENLATEPVLEGGAEFAMTSLDADENPEDDMAHVDVTEVPSDAVDTEADSTIEVEVIEDATITNAIETVEAAVEAAENTAEADVLEDAAVADAIETNVVETVEATAEVVAEVSASEPPSTDGWDHGDEGWDQTAHDWEQDPDWEASVDAAKDRTVEVAVVRISDPS